MKQLTPLMFVLLAVSIGSGAAILISRNVANPVDATNPSSKIVQQVEPSAPTPSPRSPLSLVFVGDLMFDRSVWKKMLTAGHDYPFAKVGDLFYGADLLIGNLEGPVTERGSHASPGGVLLFKFEPLVADLLGNQGFDLVSLANNHTFNQGTQGLIDTQTFLAAAGVKSFGHPRRVTYDDVRIIEQSGWRLAFLGWNLIEVVDTHETELLDLIHELNSKVDLVIVMPHWGTEYRPQTNIQVEAAHALINAGADLIIGAHPHTVQGIEIYQNRLIAYSLGNFVFDQYWSDPTQQGLALQIVFSKDNLEIEFRPVDLRASQPRPANDAIATMILQRLLNASDLPDDIEQRIKSQRSLRIPWTD